MDILIHVGMFVLGLVLLIVGAELLVRGASNIAAAVGISSLVIGLTVVAFGTSAPELAVLVQSARANEADIAIGNVVGSNICNVLLILGLSAMVTPLIVSKQLVRFDVPMMIAAALLMWGMSADGSMSLVDGCMLFGIFVTYTYWSIHQSRKQTRQDKTNEDETVSPAAARTPQEWIKNIVFFVVGLGLIVWGADFLVKSAVFIAEDVLQVPTLIVGLTVIAVGTSLPEIATSVVASLKGERDIAVGNIVGSNISNILLVLGLSSMVAPHGIEVSHDALRFDIPVMVAISAMCLPIFFTHYEIKRWEGIGLFGYYVAYTIYLVLNATNHAFLSTFTTIMIGVIAVTVLIILGMSVHILLAMRGSAETTTKIER